MFHAMLKGAISKMHGYCIKTKRKIEPKSLITLNVSMYQNDILNYETKNKKRKNKNNTLTHIFAHSKSNKCQIIL